MSLRVHEIIPIWDPLLYKTNPENSVCSHFTQYQNLDSVDQMKMTIIVDVKNQFGFEITNIEKI